MNSRNKWHKSYHIFQNTGHALDLKKHQDFNRLILGKYIYTDDNLQSTNNFQIKLQRRINFLLDLMNTEGFNISITFYYSCYCPNLRETVQIFNCIQGNWSCSYWKTSQFSRVSNACLLIFCNNKLFQHKNWCHVKTLISAFIFLHFADSEIPFFSVVVIQLFTSDSRSGHFATCWRKISVYPSSATVTLSLAFSNAFLFPCLNLDQNACRLFDYRVFLQT
jgi:hypothetical protein